MTIDWGGGRASGLPKFCRSLARACHKGCFQVVLALWPTIGGGSAVRDGL